MLAHRKRDLTPLNEPEAAPSVDFPASPHCRERLMMSRITRASSPIGKAGKSISVTTYSLNML
jgi:hypothetical protein